LSPYGSHAGASVIPMKTPALTSLARTWIALLALAAAAVAAAPAQAAFPGTPGPIAYSHGFSSETETTGGIYIHGPRQSQAPVSLTSDPGDQSPSYSADGKKIVFSGNRDAGSHNSLHLYVMNADGSGVTALTSGEENRDLNPSFSPNGQKVVFDRMVGFGHPHIFIVNVDGSGLHALTEGAYSDYDPTFAPNGRWIAFTSNRDHDVRTDRSDIFSMRPDGSNQRVLIDGPRNESEPDIAPDGRSIAFASNRKPGNNIYVARADGSHVRQLTHSPECHHRECFFSPSWAPDGKHIAFLGLRRSSSDLQVMRSDGSHLSDFTETGTEEEGYGSSTGPPSWGVRAR